MTRSKLDQELVGILTEARDLGFLGPGAVGPHVEHALGFARTVGAEPARFLDLGAGGGVPGLVLAGAWPRSRATLVDAGERRTKFLMGAVERLGMSDRVDVFCARAEVAAREPDLRERFDVVTARSFGPPAVTAECAVGFLVAGGVVVVSDPPVDVTGRWPEAGLAELGLHLESQEAVPHHFVKLRLGGVVDARWPRRTGIPAKRPVWG